MTVLIGHPTGMPSFHNAALAHFEVGQLEAFCVPWMPSAFTLCMLRHAGPLRVPGLRLARRRLAALAAAPKVQGRLREWWRLANRLSGCGEEWLVHDANDWLMRTMRRECQRQNITAVHADEDCAMSPFEKAKRAGKACIYDMPVGYYPALAQTQADVLRRYSDWLPSKAQSSSSQVRPEQKRKEMELADIVLAPSLFVEKTIRAFFPSKAIALTPYAADLAFWTPGQRRQAEKLQTQKLRFIFAGRISIHKGVPLLIEAWKLADLRDAELELVGSWHLSDAVRRALPASILHHPPCAPPVLRDRYRAADVMVFPSYFEGFGLVLVEAMACGLPVLASDATIASEIVTPASGRMTPAGNIDALVEGLRWFGANRDRLPAMSVAAREQAGHFTWQGYRRLVTQAVSPYV